MKYDFELKLKFLKFFYLHGVMPSPIQLLPKNGYYRGHDLNFTVIILRYILNKFKNNFLHIYIIIF